MDARRSFYLASKEGDFAELTADASRLDFDDIPFVMPANDNFQTKDRLSAHCGSLLRRLIALHSLRWVALCAGQITNVGCVWPLRGSAQSIS